MSNTQLLITLNSMVFDPKVFVNCFFIKWKFCYVVYHLHTYGALSHVMCVANTVRVTIKFPLNACMNAHFRSYETPVPKPVERPYA